jgi:hypothetical protein
MYVMLYVKWSHFIAFLYNVMLFFPSAACLLFSDHLILLLCDGSFEDHVTHSVTAEVMVKATESLTETPVAREAYGN